MNLPATTERVKEHTGDQVNRQIQQQTEFNIENWKHRSDADIKARITELEREWDTERVLETNASALMLTSTVLGLTHNKKWFALSGLVSAFLLQHALQGWCPPLPIIRRLGVRTSSEIDDEKYALKYELQARQ
ncbi:YgaP-like transmembrane domain [Paenibacillus dakarensis]|uniref:YgaP-like transmembrane domain n=1 Tax=Paenibacillus dakarensis TaxID=1527293 RepID=UPI0006D54877|nr:YgaP-like transmembrane domain [Paenibacillus dakarensis]